MQKLTQTPQQNYCEDEAQLAQDLAVPQGIITSVEQICVLTIGTTLSGAPQGSNLGFLLLPGHSITEMRAIILRRFLKNRFFNHPFSFHLIKKNPKEITLPTIDLMRNMFLNCELLSNIDISQVYFLHYIMSFSRTLFVLVMIIFTTKKFKQPTVFAIFSARLCSLGRKRPRRQLFSRHVKEGFRVLDIQITIIDLIIKKH
jgi:hypothetical protein